MKSTFPSQNIDLLTRLLGNKIVAVRRQILLGDMDLYEYQQMADGPIEFELISGAKLHFISETEEFSIGVVSGSMPRYGDSYKPIDLTSNDFWKARIDHEIKTINICISPREAAAPIEEFGLSIVFSNGMIALIEYVDEDDSRDTIRVSGGRCNRRHDSIKLPC